MESLTTGLRVFYETSQLSQWLAACGLVALAVLLGWASGKMFNKNWNLLNRPGALLFLLGLGLASASLWAVGNGLTQYTNWLQEKAETVEEELQESGSLNRDIFNNAWDSLLPIGGQAELMPVNEGGREIRINSVEDLQLFTEAAADVGGREIRSRFRRYLGGEEVSILPAAAVSKEVIHEVAKPIFPFIISPDNKWTKATVSIQTNYAFEKLVEPSTTRVNSGGIWKPLSWLFQAIAFFLAIYISITDIATHPKVR